MLGVLCVNTYVIDNKVFDNCNQFIFSKRHQGSPPLLSFQLNLLTKCALRSNQKKVYLFCFWNIFNIGTISQCLVELWYTLTNYLLSICCRIISQLQSRIVFTVSIFFRTLLRKSPKEVFVMFLFVDDTCVKTWTFVLSYFCYRIWFGQKSKVSL